MMLITEFNKFMTFLKTHLFSHSTSLTYCFQRMSSKHCTCSDSSNVTVLYKLSFYYISITVIKLTEQEGTVQLLLQSFLCSLKSVK